MWSNDKLDLNRGSVGEVANLDKPRRLILTQFDSGIYLVGQCEQEIALEVLEKNETTIKVQVSMSTPNNYLIKSLKYVEIWEIMAA